MNLHDQPSNQTDTIEAYLYDAVMEIDRVLDSLATRLYTGNKPTSRNLKVDRESKMFMAKRGELLGVGINQVSACSRAFWVILFAPRSLMMDCQSLHTPCHRWIG